MDAYISIVITVLIALAIVAVWLYIRRLRTVRAGDVELWAIYLVRAAEMIFDDGEGEEKLDYCLRMIDRVYPDFDPDLARSIIEYAVHVLHQEKDADAGTG